MERFCGSRSESVGNRQYPGLNFEVMEFDQMVPAPGQGAIAIQSKISDAEKYSVLGCPDTERRFGWKERS